MSLDGALLGSLTTATANDAWRAIVDATLSVAGAPLVGGDVSSEIVRRDQQIGPIDVFLSSCGWDLWRAFPRSVERTASRLERWWSDQYGGKAVLILDGLSLRELPWLLQGAETHGFTIHSLLASASELPGDTNSFARALGFISRSQLQNNGGGHGHKLQSAYTESVGLPWKDCAMLVNSSPNWIFWHHWPDSSLHDGAGPGRGLDALARDARAQLTSQDFWGFVERLATGRRVVITSDHGYAATGYFSDVDSEVGQYLKQTFGSGRFADGVGEPNPFVPPISLQVDNEHGTHVLAIGRRKWRSQGGYPTLTHGGLSLLEVLSPFIEISK